MKKVIAIVFTFLFVCSIAGIASAVEEKATEKKPRVKTRQVTGEVTVVDMKANTITVKGKNGPVTATYDDKTKVTMNKEKKTISDVKAGDRVTLKFTGSDGKEMAKKILIKPEGKKTGTGKTRESQ